MTRWPDGMLAWPCTLTGSAPLILENRYGKALELDKTWQPIL